MLYPEVGATSNLSLNGLLCEGGVLWQAADEADPPSVELWIVEDAPPSNENLGR